ncbi:KH domain protein [Cryptosporidium felis]|nr:KH domain protein [Cryptosporidium felis]
MMNNNLSIEKKCENTKVGRKEQEIEQEEEVVFVKLLVSDRIADKILGNSGSILRKIKQVNHVFILVSGTEKYFPGTKYRVVTLEGNEKNVNETMEFLDFLLKNDCHENGSSKNFEYTVRLAVPRSVIGSIIGVKGEFISHVRTVTSAHIIISPIFVASEKACNERIITISGNDSNQIIHAFIILTKKINSSPEGKSCKSIIYKRADIFKKKQNKYEHENPDPLLDSQLEEMKSALNNVPMNSALGTESKSKQEKNRPSLKFRTTTGGRWSEQVDLLLSQEHEEIIENKPGPTQKELRDYPEGVQAITEKTIGNLSNYFELNSTEKVHSQMITGKDKISTSLFIISLFALITGALFFQYISSDLVYV